MISILEVAFLPNQLWPTSCAEFGISNVVAKIRLALMGSNYFILFYFFERTEKYVVCFSRYYQMKML